LGLLATFTPEVVPFRPYAPFPAILPFLKFFLEVVFCKGVKPNIIRCTAPAAILPPSPESCQSDGFSFLSSIGERQKSRVGENDGHVVFEQKFSGESESVRQCVVVMQQPVLIKSLKQFWSFKQNAGRWIMSRTVIVT
jgi:hypothetical protein